MKKVIFLSLSISIFFSCEDSEDSFNHGYYGNFLFSRSYSSPYTSGFSTYEVYIRKALSFEESQASGGNGCGVNFSDEELEGLEYLIFDYGDGTKNGYYFNPETGYFPSTGQFGCSWNASFSSDKNRININSISGSLGSPSHVDIEGVRIE